MYYLNLLKVCCQLQTFNILEVFLLPVSFPPLPLYIYLIKNNVLSKPFSSPLLKSFNVIST